MESVVKGNHYTELQDKLSFLTQSHGNRKPRPNRLQQDTHINNTQGSINTDSCSEISSMCSQTRQFQAVKRKSENPKLSHTLRIFNI